MHLLQVKRNTFDSSLFSTKPGSSVSGRRSREAASQGGSRGSLLPCPVPGGGRDEGGRAGGRPRAGPAAPPAPRSQVLPASETRSRAAGRLRGLEVLKPAAGVLLVVFPSGKRNPAGAPARQRAARRRHHQARLFHVDQTHAGQKRRCSSCPCRAPETDGPWAKPA